MMGRRLEEIKNNWCVFGWKEFVGKFGLIDIVFFFNGYLNDKISSLTFWLKGFFKWNKFI